MLVVMLRRDTRLSIDNPLAKPSLRRTLPKSSDSEDVSDQVFLGTPSSQRSPLQYQVGQARFPPLQSTVDELAVSEYNDHIASLTSETNASSSEKARTPLEKPTEYPLSPPFYRRRYAEGEGSLRRASRRSSTWSGHSTSFMSPAASFLSRYNPMDGQLNPPNQMMKVNKLGTTASTLLANRSVTAVLAL